MIHFNQKQVYSSKVKDIPQLELLLRIVLYHNTWPSGHRIFLQKKVSIATVRAAADRKLKPLYYKDVLVSHVSMFVFLILYSLTQ